jgi:Uma2 family endonuclease
MESTCLLTDEALVTAKELFEHPEWNPCELVRGKVTRMSPAGGKHGLVALRIGAAIDGFARPRKLGDVFAAETGFYIEHDPDTIRAPDVSFLSRERIPVGGIPDEFIPIVPDLAVEVLSPSDTWKEVDRKAAEYLRAGVRLVWGVEPRTRCARVYRSGRAVLELTESQALIGEDVLPGFELELCDIF